MRSKALAINIIASSSGLVITLLINFFLTPFIVGTLGAEAYGFVSLINNLVSYLSLITIALNSMASRFVSINIYKGDIDGANRYFSSVIISNLVLSAFIGIFSIPLILNLEVLLNIPDNLLKDVKILTILVLVNFIVQLLSSVFNIAVFVKNKLYLTSLRNVEIALLKAFILITLFIFLKPKVYFVGISVVISALYGIIWNMGYTKKNFTELNVSTKYFDLQSIKELILSGIWNVVNNFSGILNNGLDILISNIFINPLEMGILAISKTIPNIFFNLVGALSSTFSPGFTKNYAKGNEEELVKALNESTKVLGLFMSTIVGVFIAWGDVFFRLWVPSQNPSKLYIVSVISILPLIIIGSTAGIYEIFMITNKIKKKSLVELMFGIFNILIVLLLLNKTKLGIYAIAGVSSITEIIKNLLFTLPYAARCIEQKWYIFYKPAFKNAVSILLIFSLSFIIKIIMSPNNWGQFIILVGICAGVGIIINLLLIFDKNDRKMMKKSLISRFKLKKM